MKSSAIFAIAALFSLGLVSASATAQTGGQVNYTEMAEDIEVMCRIIDQTMKDTFKKEYRESGFFGGRGCRGFYLNGYGVVFQVDLTFPVADKVVKVLKQEKETDLWDRYEREVRRQPQPEEARWISEKNEAYDPDQVDKLKQKLAFVVGEYGARVGQLRSDDMISIVVFGRTGDTFEWEPFEMPGIRFNFDTPDALLLEEQVRQLEEQVHKVEEQAHAAAQNAREVEELNEEQARELKERAKAAAEKAREVEAEARKIKKEEREVVVDGDKVIVQTPSKPKPRAFAATKVDIAPVINNLLQRGGLATTMILTFNRSQLEGKKGADWERLLKDAQVVQY